MSKSNILLIGVLQIGGLCGGCILKHLVFLGSVPVTVVSALTGHMPLSLGRSNENHLSVVLQLLPMLRQRLVTCFGVFKLEFMHQQ